MFIDKARIFVRAGKGGDGCLSFHREKYVPFGPPDGGSGGKGGDVYIQSTSHMSTLYDLTYRPHLRAKDGLNGRGNNWHGKNEDDLIIYVPSGTVIYKNGKLLADLACPDQKVLVAKGGRGGRGNASFKTKTTVAPKISEKGEPGEDVTIDLELKLIADVGVIGLPNAGKSTLLARISSARPKIADYPFTTLTPNLGVVSYKNKSFILADIPGLVEGASYGKGLGNEFLRHIERTRIIIHLVDINGFSDEPAENNYSLVKKELREYSKILAKKPALVAVNKIDITGATEKCKKFRKKLSGKDVIAISAATGEGIDILLNKTIELLSKVCVEETIAEKPAGTKEYVFEQEFSVCKEGDVFVVKGTKVENLVAMTNFNQDESVRRLQNILKKMGLDRYLKKHGVKENDTVKIGKFEFTYMN